MELKTLSAKAIQTIRVTTSGRMESDVVLTLKSLSINGTINGQELAKPADTQKTYNLLAHLETLQLPKSVIPLGKPPRGQTLFHITYENGESILLAMNPNTPPGETYYELTPEQFEHLFNLWGQL